MKNKVIALAAFGALVPQLAFAQLENFSTLIRRVGDIIELLIPLLIGVAVVVFIFNIVKFIIKSNDAEARKDASKGIIFSLIGIFVIVSLFGLVELLQDAFDVDNENRIETGDIPTIPGL
jgi:hypothetical protein